MSHYVFAVVVLLTLAGIAIGRLVYKKPALTNVIVTATAVLTLLCTVLEP